MDYIWIKYYYTSIENGSYSQRLQVQVEDEIEALFNEEVNVNLYYINTDVRAYREDFVEVSHTIPLNKVQKQKIYDIIKTNIIFYENSSDKADIDIFADIYQKTSYLKNAVFYYIPDNNVL
jgi:hypothetical protein